MLDFIAYNRMNAFVTKLVTVSNTITDANYLDNSPNGIFTGPQGTVLQKKGNVISYKYPGDEDFSILNYASPSIGSLLNKYGVILNRGVNKDVTWVKTDSQNGTSWVNRGSSTNTYDLCQVYPCAPFVPTVTIEPTVTPICGQTYCLYVNYLTVSHLIIDSTGQCEPAPNDPGYYGELRICENYMYVYDGTRWKRSELTTY